MMGQVSNPSILCAQTGAQAQAFSQSDDIKPMILIMAFSAASNLSKKKERDRLERVLVAYQGAIDHDEADKEVSQFLYDSTNCTANSEEQNEGDESESSGNQDGGMAHQEDAGKCVKLPWQEFTFAAFYFLTGCAPAMLLPYLSVYYRQLGLNSREIGVLKSLQPWIAIPAIPLWGCLADRLHVTRFLFMVSLTGYLVSNVIIAFTPKVDEVDCQTAMSEICKDPKSIIKYEVQQRFEPVTAIYMPHMPHSAETTLSTNATKLCLPDGQYMGYFYEKNDLSRLLIYLVIINIVGEIWQAPTPALGNAAVLNGLGKKKRNHYGYYKAVGAVGAAIGTAKKPTKEYHFRDVVASLCTIRYGGAFLAITWLSIAVGVAKAFDYWYIEILGGSHSIMAWTGMIGTLVLIATFLALPYLNDHFGHLPFLVLALVVTGAGCAVSAFIANPWWMTLPMCLRGIATATSTQSAGAYLANAVDKDHMATLQTIMAAIIFGVGNGAGSLLGGILIKSWSPFVCYSVFGVASFIFSGLLTLASKEDV
ncbi:major facilitator superfamily domain-containing protein 6-like [Amphiura filiformis]|uniref:major facilitator superfamily domain-containing protein 6-like n=1 Tax=Amphiura filiformis TaxID=82378 RepID=UPI003B21B0B0